MSSKYCWFTVVFVGGGAGWVLTIGNPGRHRSNSHADLQDPIPNGVMWRTIDGVHAQGDVLATKL
jgi:hypothetical protein